ncbi:TPA: hypothetical protein ACXNW8_001330 [Clostridium botulinum]|uniref:hypothetical protein n=1 Tax=Clostridium botulinum TaxID=1491 RepID=UPI001C9A7295|nr:hypothetical protein [Clostridium botulinum]MBY6909532.1 hypothetical protein [Clostridium botulinum]
MSHTEVVASYCLCNIASLNIYEVNTGIDEFVIAGINDLKSRKYKLYYTGKGTYFNFGGSRFYLNDFIRC